MNVFRTLCFATGLSCLFCFGSQLWGQIVINELVKEQRDANNDGASVTPDVTEFVELYNAGASAVDLTGWTLGTFNLLTGTPDAIDTISSGSIAPGGYFVISHTGDFQPLVTGEIWTDAAARVMELKNPLGAMQDAVAYDVWRTGTTRLANAAPDQLAQIGSGYQGELFNVSPGTAAPTVSSWSRYRDGRDTNKNGLDFGLLPPTPGASNNLPINNVQPIPNVESMNVGDTLSSQFHTSFVLPTVINTTVAGGALPHAIPAPPTGTKAIVAWDPSGGGNSVYAKELTNGFDLNAYFDTTPLVISPASNDEEWQTSIYGIGSTDAFFRNPDPNAGIPQIPLGTASEPVTRNSSTGVGWVYQQYDDGSNATPDFTKLMLIDFGDGGDSEVPGEWNILDTIDMTTVTSGWYRLALSYNPATHEITGTFNNQTFTHMLPYDLFGTFFVGYREGITGSPGAQLAAHDPPVFIMNSAGTPGDYNNDGKVDAADYVVWRKNVGTNNVLPNDPTGGTVGTAQYNTWTANFGKPPGAGSGSLFANVPEPASMTLVALGLAFVAAARRRR